MGRERTRQRAQNMMKRVVKDEGEELGLEDRVPPKRIESKLRLFNRFRGFLLPYHTEYFTVE